MTEYALKWEKLYQSLAETFAPVANPLGSLLASYESLIETYTNSTAEQIRKDGVLSIASTRPADDMALRPLHDGYKVTRAITICMLACPSELTRPKCMDVLKLIISGHSEFLLFNDKVFDQTKTKR